MLVTLSGSMFVLFARGLLFTVLSLRALIKLGVDSSSSNIGNRIRVGVP